MREIKVLLIHPDGSREIVTRLAEDMEAAAPTAEEEN